MKSTPRFWFLVFAFSLTSALLISRSGNWMSHSVIVTEPSRTSHRGAVQTQPTLATPKSTHILAANELDQNSATKAAAADHALNTAFIAWTTRYLSVPATNRETLLPEGIELARSRRPLFKELIRRAPRAALAAAIPREIRHQLPAEVLAELEKLVSARAELAVIQTCLHPPGVEHDHAGDLYRATVIDDREYRVHVYGTRLSRNDSVEGQFLMFSDAFPPWFHRIRPRAIQLHCSWGRRSVSPVFATTRSAAPCLSPPF